MEKSVSAILAITAFIFSLPLQAKATTCVCGDDDGNITLSLMTNDSGQLLDLAVVLEDQALIERFPEANSTNADTASDSYRFSVDKKAGHDALELDIKGKKGVIHFRNKISELECNWQ